MLNPALLIEIVDLLCNWHTQIMRDHCRVRRKVVKFKTQCENVSEKARFGGRGRLEAVCDQ